MLTRHGLPLLALLVTLPGLGHSQDILAVPDLERQAIRKLVDELVRLGLPDTAGSTYFVGPAYVQQQFDPSKEKPVVPTTYSRIQETAPDSEMIYKYIVPGPHFRLANGRWLLGLQYLLIPNEQQQVFTHKLEKLELASIRRDAMGAHPIQGDADFDEWFEKISAPDLETFKLAVSQGVPLWQYLQLPRNDLSLGTCLLLRAGADDVDILCYTIADARCRDYWRMHPWSNVAPPFDPTGQYEGVQKLEKRWHDERKTYEVEPLSVAFRRDLHRYFFRLLRQPESPFEPETAAALAHATLDENDPQKRSEKIKSLLASITLPHEVTTNADLASLLQAWGEFEQATVVVNTTGNANPSITTTSENFSAEFSPTKKHLNELFMLLDDPRPSRWVDFQGSRSIGENAMRAIAIVLQMNPLELVGHDVATPWTDQTRLAVNRSLRAWWESNRSKYGSSER